MARRGQSIWSRLFSAFVRGSSAADSDWNSFCQTLQQADDVAENRAGHCAMTSRGARRLTAAMKAWPEELATMEQSGLIGPAERQLLELEARCLERDVRARLGMELSAEQARIASQAPAAKSLHDLCLRIEALEALSQAQPKHAQAAELILADAAAHVKILGNRTMLRQLVLARRGEAGEIRSRAQQCIDRIRTATGDIRKTA